MAEAKKLVPKRRFKEFQNAEAWEEYELGSVTEYKNGKGHEDRQTKSGKYELVNLNSISIDGGLKRSGKFIDDTTDTLLKNDLVMVLSDVGHGDLLGRVALIPENDRFVLNQRVALLRPNSTVDPQFLFSYINANQKYFKSQGAGMSQLNMSKGNVESFTSFMPQKEEQEKIGKLFNDIDNLITLHQRKLDKIKSLKEAYLFEMFPAEGESKPKRRFKGFTDDWEECELSRICSMNARIGWQNLRTSEFLDRGDYYLITGTDFKNGRVDFNTCHYVEKYRFDQDQKIQITNGSILITKDGTLGKVAYVEGLDKPATLNAGVFNITTTSKNIDEKYLFQYLKAPFLMNYVDKRATGGTIKHLNKNILVDFPINLPQIKEQQAIGNFFSNLDNLIALHQQKLDKLKNLKKSYLNEMFI